MVIFNKKLKVPKPRSMRLDGVERRQKSDNDNIVIDLGCDKFEFKEGVWSQIGLTGKKHHQKIDMKIAKDDEIKMMTAKYDILLDLLTELTLNNNDNRP